MPPSLEVAALTVRSDEPAWQLEERTVHIPFSNLVRRHQFITVARNDRLVVWKDDLGDASLFPHARPIFIRGGFVDTNGRGHVYETVGTLREIAEGIRNRTKAEWDAIYGEVPERDWRTEYHEERERRARTHKTLPVAK